MTVIQSTLPMASTAAPFTTPAAGGAFTSAPSAQPLTPAAGNQTPSLAVGYIRVSTEHQASEGVSLDAQRDQIAAWAERTGSELAGIFEDAGVTGSRIDKRPGLLSAIDALRPGSVLVVTKRDRLARGEPMLICWIEKEVARRKARIVSLAGEGTDGGDPDDPTAVLMRRIIDAFAEYERLVIKARTRVAMARKRRNGQRVGELPYGWTLAPDGMTLLPIPDEQAILAEIRRLRSAGWKYRRIARELNRRGVPTKKGAAGWTHQAVRSILARSRSIAALPG